MTNTSESESLLQTLADAGKANPRLAENVSQILFDTLEAPQIRDTNQRIENDSHIHRISVDVFETGDFERAGVHEWSLLTESTSGLREDVESEEHFARARSRTDCILAAAILHLGQSLLHANPSGFSIVFERLAAAKLRAEKCPKTVN